MQAVDYPNSDLYPEQTPLNYETSTDSTATHSTENGAINWIEVIKFLLVVFAYGWWSIIVVYFGLLDESASLHLQVMSAPVIVASLALARLFQMAIKSEAFGFSILFFSGLLVAGMLA